MIQGDEIIYLWLVACQIKAHLYLAPVARVAPDEIEWRKMLLCKLKLLFFVGIFIILL
jgi:hypothetical protein